MSLTTGRGPLSRSPAGRFTAPMPSDVAYIEPFRRRVRATKDGQTVVDSERVLLVHRPGRPPSYAFPHSDVQRVPTEAETDAPGYVTVAWDAADAWFEEAEEVFGHPRNPYHRIDCLRSDRHLTVEAGGTTLVDTTDTLVVYETSLDRGCTSTAVTSGWNCSRRLYPRPTAPTRERRATGPRLVGRGPARHRLEL